MRTLIAALLLLALPAAAQEPNNGLLVYGSPAQIHLGGTWDQSDEPSGHPQPWGQLDLASAGVGYHWGRTGLMLSVTAVSFAQTGLTGGYRLARTVAPVYLHVVTGVTRAWTSGRPVLGVFAGYRPLLASQLTAGIEAKWRFGLVSPSVRAQWRWFFDEARTDPYWPDTYAVSLSAGVELGGIWALGRHK
jgi:hypothetical protein